MKYHDHSAKMAPAISLVHAICLVLAQLIFLNVTKSEVTTQYTNATDQASLSVSGRLKRSPTDQLLRQLHIQIRYETGELVDINWILVDQYLANHYLPVVTPFAYSNRRVMDDVGDFLMYHDVSKCSAVVYFLKHKILHGVVGMNHYIDYLPFDFDEKGMYRLGVVGEPYVRKMVHSFVHINPHHDMPPPSDVDVVEDFFRPSDHGLDRSNQCTFRGDPGPSAKRPRIQQDSDDRINKEEFRRNEYIISNVRKRRENRSYKYYYLEILSFITRDIVEHFERVFGDQCIEQIIKSHIIYFNSVDMMIRKLRSHRGEIRLNIAKIVIEDVLNQFDFIVSEGDLQVSNIITKVPQYLRRYQRHYTIDSFDHVFIQTGRIIMDDTVLINGMTKHGNNLYEARKNDQFYEAVPITVASFQAYYAGNGGSRDWSNVCWNGGCVDIR